MSTDLNASQLPIASLQQGSRQNEGTERIKPSGPPAGEELQAEDLSVTDLADVSGGNSMVSIEEKRIPGSVIFSGTPTGGSDRSRNISSAAYRRAAAGSTVATGVDTVKKEEDLGEYLEVLKDMVQGEYAEKGSLRIASCLKGVMDLETLRKLKDFGVTYSIPCINPRASMP